MATAIPMMIPLKEDARIFCAVLVRDSFEHGLYSFLSECVVCWLSGFQTMGKLQKLTAMERIKRNMKHVPLPGISGLAYSAIHG